jgi:uncharacterized phage infection (PIP) family protein YhgE
MPDEKQHPKASDILRALHEFAREAEEDVAKKPRNDVQNELKRRGIDAAPLIANVKQQLAKAKANAELAAARAKRESAINARLKAIYSKIDEAPEALRRRWQKLLAEDPAVAFSKFEEATDADLQSLLNDLDLLDKPNDKDSTGEG